LLKQPDRQAKVTGWEMLQSFLGEEVDLPWSAHAMAFFLGTDQPIGLQSCDMMPYRDWVDVHGFSQIVDCTTVLFQQGLKHPLSS
jgi:hypothetical protein